MPGGPESTWEVMKPIFESIAAKVDGQPCVIHIGPGGAGHYVKMIHNGIEYGDMQLICEAYSLFKAAGFTNAEMAAIFTEWNEGELQSYLIQITGKAPDRFPDDDSFLFTLAVEQRVKVVLVNGHADPDPEKDEARYLHTVAEDRSFALHEWALEPDDDTTDLKLVKQVNPASWQTEDLLRERRDSPSTLPWQWLRFACGIWTETEEPWISPALWDRLGEQGLELDPEAATWVGVDVGVSKDSTAVVTVAARGDGELAAKARIMRPPAEGGLPLKRVEDAVREACEGRNVQAVLFDPGDQDIETGKPADAAMGDGSGESQGSIAANAPRLVARRSRNVASARGPSSSR